jgi:Short C-terminal domain
MTLLVVWVLFALLVGWLGEDRVIGFWGSFFVALLLSPLVGFIVVIFSKPLKEKELQQQTFNAQVVQNSLLAQMANGKAGGQQSFSVADELEKLKKLLDSGALTQEEYQKAKGKLMAQFD